EDGIRDRNVTGVQTCALPIFRREPVLEKIGYWDEVRFAADGEFKRRLIQAFGKEAVIDLETGPLSLPEQSSTSLTGSSAFGYAGFFMGARKEDVDSFTDYRSEEHTSELQSRFDLVCRLLLEKKNIY